LNLPASLNELGIPATQKALDDCFEFINTSSAMAEAPADGAERLRKAIQTIILL
jgi:hypothetical protein